MCYVRQEDQNDGNGGGAGGTVLCGHDGGADPLPHERLCEPGRGWLLGPWRGAAAGGSGSMLADLLLGYGHYAPGTLIIKGAMALVAALIFKAFKKNTAGALVGGVAAEVVMVAGYFGYAALLLGKGIGAAASIPGNLVQGAVGLVAGFLLLQVARRTHLEEKVCV